MKTHQPLGIDTGASAQEHTCGPHPEGAVFCDGKDCKVFNESTGELRDLPPTNDYHYGGVMSYIDGVGIIVIGGTSSDAGRIEVFDGNEWKQITQGEADQWSTDLVQLPSEYKYFTATQEPNCMNQDWCKGMFFSTVTVRKEIPSQL